MEKLTYTKIADVTLEINLHNGYEVIAFAKYNPETKKYNAKFYIKDKFVDNLIAMEDFENIEFNGNKKFICPNILKFVSKNFENGNFDKYISRCEYEQKCFEKGDYICRNEEKVLRPIRSKLAYNLFYCPECDLELDGEEFCPCCHVGLDWNNIVEPEEVEEYMTGLYGEDY